MRSWVLGLFAMVVSCAKAPCPAAPAIPAPARSSPQTSSTWPDVAAPLRRQVGHQGDAALVVAIEHYPNLPAVAGALEAGRDWVWFLTEGLGVPAARVTMLHDSEATKRNILTALARRSLEAEAGGRLWFVFVGHGGVELVPADGGDARDPVRRLLVPVVLDAAAQGKAQPVAVLDTGFDRGLVAELGSHGDRKRPGPVTPRSAIVLEGGESGFLPGASRPAFSYFFIGALRGWADANDDGRVTAREVFDFTHEALRITRSGRLGSHPDLYSEFECRSFTTLSMSKEKAPELADIARRRFEAPRSAPAPEVKAAADAVRAADVRVEESNLRYAETNGKEGFPALPPLRFTDERALTQWLEGPPIPFPSAVADAVNARIRHAAALGGVVNPKAAAMLVEAARMNLEYRRLDGVRDLVQPVLDAQCGLDRSGYDARMTLYDLIQMTKKYSERHDLDELECGDYRDPTSVPLRQSRGVWDSGLKHYDAASKATDQDVARCEWEDAAIDCGVAARMDLTRIDEPEPALTGADAYRRLGRAHEAAELIELYVRAQAHGVRGDDPSDAVTRHRYTVMACNQFLDLVRETPALLPAYSDSCLDQGWLNCAEGDAADCAGTCPGDGKTCARWAAHAEEGIGVMPDPSGARRVWNSLCDAGDKPSCERIGRSESVRSLPEELRRMRESARNLDRKASNLEELSTWETGPHRLRLQKSALDQFRAAESAWRAVVERRASDRDAAGGLLGLAQARYSAVALTVSMGQVPAAGDVESARLMARFARDATLGERRKVASGLLVDLADRILEGQEGEFERTNGARGIERRKELRFEGDADGRRVVRTPVPPLIADAVRARDEYAATVSPTDDLEQTRGRYEIEAARTYFSYGQFDEARRRLEAILERECGRSAFGYEAWELLLRIFASQNDAPALKSFVAGPSCAIDAETKFREEVSSKPRPMNYFMVDCMKAFNAAAHLPAGKEHDEVVRNAAICFADFVSVAPLRSDAPMAAIRGAQSYAAIGERARAIALYETYVDRYATEAVLAATEKGDRDAKPPVLSSPKNYDVRIFWLRGAYEALAKLHESVHDHRRAALALVALSARKRLPRGERLVAARRAVAIAGARGALGMLRTLDTTLAELAAPEAERRRVKGLVARATATVESAIR